jgi:hypothetical protein
MALSAAASATAQRNFGALQADPWIAQLINHCKPLTEDEVRQLCDKVRGSQAGRAARGGFER